MDEEVGNAHHKLFGGAQYHRALREFTLAVRLMKTPTVTEDEIANAAGVGDMHDGVNFMRAACVIAVEKVRGSMGGVLCSGFRGVWWEGLRDQPTRWPRA